MKLINTTLIFLIFCGLVINSNAMKIHTIGDSTMAKQDENSTDKRGWGMMFQQFFSTDITVNNRAKSGASSKSFYLEAPYWETVKKQIETGDYVLIQFGHNDEKNGGLDGDTVRATTDPTADYRGTTAQGTYKNYLRAYVNETRALGGIPILATPMCRKYFSGGTITRKGRHDLGENFGVNENDHSYDYAYAMKEVATELEVPLLDLTSSTKNLFEEYGDAACTELIFSANDGTHPNALGATLVARLCAQEMSAQNILTSSINSSADLLINPSIHDFGNAYIGQTLKKEFTISGFDLKPESGSVTFTVTDGFQISTEKDGSYESSITINYTNGNVDFTRFYINVSSKASGLKQGSLTVTNGNVNKTVSLNANFIELTGGTEVKVQWRLESDNNYELTGPAMAIDESYSEMYAQRFAQPNSNTLTETDKWDVSRRMQRNLIEGDIWPAGEIDEVSTRYIQYGITASEGTELNIDSIGLFIAAAGGNGMRCRLSYSVDNFSTSNVVQEFPSMVANTVYEVSTIPVEKLSYGDTLLLRVYPWYSGEASGKTICLADVCIHGVATSISSIKSKENISTLKYYFANEVLTLKGVNESSKIEIYNISGKKVQVLTNTDNSEIRIPLNVQRGIYMCKISSANNREIIKFRVL